MRSKETVAGIRNTLKECSTTQSVIARPFRYDRAKTIGLELVILGIGPRPYRAAKVGPNVDCGLPATQNSSQKTTCKRARDGGGLRFGDMAFDVVSGFVAKHKGQFVIVLEFGQNLRGKCQNRPSVAIKRLIGV